MASRQHSTTHYHLTINGIPGDPYLTESGALAAAAAAAADSPEECSEPCVTDEHLTAYICLDTGRTVGSRYGRNTHELAPLALALVGLYSDADEGIGDTLDGIMSALVNDSDDPETLILQTHGPREAARLLDYLDADTIQACHRAHVNNY